MTQLPSDICKEHGIEAFKNNSFWQKVKISLFFLKPCLHKSVYLANLSSREQRVKSHREEAEALRVKPRKWHQPGSAVAALQRDTAARGSKDTCEQTRLGQRKRRRGRVNRIHEGRHGHACAHSTATPPTFGQLVRLTLSRPPERPSAQLVLMGNLDCCLLLISERGSGGFGNVASFLMRENGLLMKSARSHNLRGLLVRS